MLTYIDTIYQANWLLNYIHDRKDRIFSRNATLTAGVIPFNPTPSVLKIVLSFPLLGARHA
jgi:hypothetical protein